MTFEPCLVIGMMDEKRFTKAEGIKIEERSMADGSKRPVMTGYAIVFNSQSVPISEGGKRFIEEIAPGAVTKTLQENRSIRALFNHDYSKPLGSVRAGNLKLATDEIGLRFELDVPDVSWGHDAIEATRSGLIEGVSFGFTVPSPDKEEWTRSQGDLPRRRLKEIKLTEISPVYSPAYPATSISVRSYFEQHGYDAKVIDEIEKLFVEESEKRTDTAPQGEPETTRTEVQSESTFDEAKAAVVLTQFLPSQKERSNAWRFVV